MTLYCPKCGKAIPAVDVNIHAMLAKCGRCNRVFKFDSSGGPDTFSHAAPSVAAPAHVGHHATDGGTADGTPAMPRTLAEKVDRFRAEVDAAGLPRRWSRPPLVGLLWRLGLDVPPVALWSSWAYGLVNALWLFTLDELLRGIEPPNLTRHVGFHTACLVGVGIVAAIAHDRWFGHLPLSAWYGTTSRN